MYARKYLQALLHFVLYLNLTYQSPWLELLMLIFLVPLTKKNIGFPIGFQL